MLSEFDLIAQYFTRPEREGAQVALGVGDDCALLKPSPGMQIAVSTDMLVEGRHFFPGTDPYKLGHKSLAVNLSDLAAMGARPLAFTLALALPEANANWLAPFSEGLLALADRHDCALIGGDTTKGPLNICITVFGEVQPGKALRRDAAQAGDDIWISGALGEARLALAACRDELALDGDALYACTHRRRAWSSALHCVESPMPQSIFRTDSPATLFTYSSVQAGGRRWTSMPFPAVHNFPCRREPCAAVSCWLAATITNCVSPRRRSAATQCSKRPGPRELP